MAYGNIPFDPRYSNILLNPRASGRNRKAEFDQIFKEYVDKVKANQALDAAAAQEKIRGKLSTELKLERIKAKKKRLDDLAKLRDKYRQEKEKRAKAVAQARKQGKPAPTRGAPKSNPAVLVPNQVDADNPAAGLRKPVNISDAVGGGGAQQVLQAATGANQGPLPTAPPFITSQQTITDVGPRKVGAGSFLPFESTRTVQGVKQNALTPGDVLSAQLQQERAAQQQRQFQEQLEFDKTDAARRAKLQRDQLNEQIYYHRAQTKLATKEAMFAQLNSLATTTNASPDVLLPAWRAISTGDFKTAGELLANVSTTGYSNILESGARTNNIMSDTVLKGYQSKLTEMNTRIAREQVSLVAAQTATEEERPAQIRIITAKLNEELKSVRTERRLTEARIRTEGRTQELLKQRARLVKREAELTHQNTINAKLVPKRFKVEMKNLDRQTDLLDERIADLKAGRPGVEATAKIKQAEAERQDLLAQRLELENANLALQPDAVKQEMAERRKRVEFLEAQRKELMRNIESINVQDAQRRANIENLKASADNQTASATLSRARATQLSLLNIEHARAMNAATKDLQALTGEEGGMLRTTPSTLPLILGINTNYSPNPYELNPNQRREWDQALTDDISNLAGRQRSGALGFAGVVKPGMKDGSGITMIQLQGKLARVGDMFTINGDDSNTDSAERLPGRMPAKDLFAVLDLAYFTEIDPNWTSAQRNQVQRMKDIAVKVAKIHGYDLTEAGGFVAPGRHVEGEHKVFMDWAVQGVNQAAHYGATRRALIEVTSGGRIQSVLPGVSDADINALLMLESGVGGSAQ